VPSFIKEDYGYTIGVIRVLEAKLFSVHQYDRMIGSETAESAYIILNDTDFSEFLPEFQSVKDFEKVLEKSLLKTKELLDKITPNDYIMKGMWKWYDFYNVKTLLKAFLQKKTFEDVKDMLSPFGATCHSKLKDFVFNNIEIKKFSKAKEEAILLYKQKKNIRFVDFVFDKALFSYLQDWANKVGTSFVLQYLRKKIDLTNIQTLFRMDETTKKDLGEIAFIPNGNFPWKDFNESPEKTRKIILSTIKNEHDLNEFENNHNFKLLEKASEDTLIDFLRETRYISEGPIPIMGYWLSRERSADIIRSILVGKLNGVDNEEIRRNTKKVY